jgi:hypothetical protein
VTGAEKERFRCKQRVGGLIAPAVTDELQDQAYAIRHRVYCEEPAGKLAKHARGL